LIAPTLNYRLVLEYDGSDFHGWQAQPARHGVRTVAGELLRAIETVTGEQPVMVAAGRTDAGAHSLGQTVNFHLKREIEPARLLLALNQLLPADVAVLSADIVEPEFHARFSARRRHYRYLVENRGSRPALLRQRAWHVRQPLNLGAMRRAARGLTGRRDLSAFGRDPAGRNTERNLEHIRIRRLRGADGGIVAFELAADAYLYGMARRIVGLLVDVGLGRRAPGDVADPGRARVAPAHGLYQLKIDYPAPATARASG
jgi:tRNA pseudouridine38-40 synthase